MKFCKCTIHTKIAQELCMSKFVQKILSAKIAPPRQCCTSFARLRRVNLGLRIFSRFCQFTVSCDFSQNFAFTQCFLLCLRQVAGNWAELREKRNGKGIDQRLIFTTLLVHSLSAIFHTILNLHNDSCFVCGKWQGITKQSMFINNDITNKI